MRVSGFWSLTGLIVLGLIAGDFLLHPTGTKTAVSGLTTLSTNTGNQLLGTPAK